MLERFVVRQDGAGLGSEEVDVPDPEQAEQHRQVVLQGGRAEVLVEEVGASQQPLEARVADGEGDRQPDGRPQRVAAADPVPELEDALARDAEPGGLFRRCRERDEVARHGGLVSRSGNQPIAGGARVHHRLLGRERLGGDEEERRGGVEGRELAVDGRAVDVGHEPHPHAGHGVRLEGPHDHLGSEVGAADADVDDVGDPRARMAPPSAAVDGLGERVHAVQDAAHLRHDVRALHLDRASGEVAQGHVEDRPALRDVDALAGEHRGPGLLEARGAGEVEQQVDRLVGDQVLAVVDQHLGRAERQAAREAPEPARVLREGFPQDEAPRPVPVPLEGGPRGAPRRLVAPPGGGRPPALRHGCRLRLAAPGRGRPRSPARPRARRAASPAPAGPRGRPCSPPRRRRAAGGWCAPTCR